MDHISIVCSSQPNRFCIPKATYEDIKLDGVLPANVLELMQVIPTPEDMRTRQDIFRYLLERGCDELKKLSAALYELRDIYRAFDRAENDSVRVYIFVCLLFRQYRFYYNSSQLILDTGFFCEYKRHFASLYDEKINCEVSGIYNTLLRRVSLEIKQDGVVIKPYSEDGYITALDRCARDMGIELFNRGFAAKDPGSDIAICLESLFSEKWKAMSELYSKYSSLLDREILSYIDQFDFYIYNTALAREYISHGIPVCYACCGEDISVAEGYDITLMAKKCYDIIPNDISFTQSEPVYFLAGANGGGKTTYLRTVGVCVIMSLCGCPVPATHSRICALDSVLTHFPRDERFELDGRLADEQKRLDYIFENMGKRSLILLNETYATTNEEKASAMTCALASGLKDRGQFAVYVTHQKGARDTDIPMLCCVIDENDGGRRTYKIRAVRDSVRSHAEDILKKYSLSRADLEERFGI